MSLFTFDPELNQQLNDIDEFIREQCGGDLVGTESNNNGWFFSAQIGQATVGRSRNLIYVSHW